MDTETWVCSSDVDSRVRGRLKHFPSELQRPSTACKLHPMTPSQPAASQYPETVTKNVANS